MVNSSSQSHGGLSLRFPSCPSLSFFSLLRRGWREVSRVATRRSRRVPLRNRIQVARARDLRACIRECDTCMRVYGRMRAARSLRRGRRITCLRHMSPWTVALLPLLIPLAHPQRIFRPPYGHVCFGRVSRPSRLPACACPGANQVFFFLRPGTHDIPFLSWVRRITSQNIASAVRLSLSLSLFLRPKTDQWNDSSEMRSLGVLN